MKGMNLFSDLSMDIDIWNEKVTLEMIWTGGLDCGVIRELIDGVIVMPYNRVFCFYTKWLGAVIVHIAHEIRRESIN